MKSIPLEEIRIGNLAYGIYEDENGKQQKNICKILAVDSTGSLGDGWFCVVVAFLNFPPFPCVDKLTTTRRKDQYEY